MAVLITGVILLVEAVSVLTWIRGTRSSDVTSRGWVGGRGGGHVMSSLTGVSSGR